MKARFTQEQAEARCLEHGYQWPKGVVYKNSTTKYPVICLTCGDDRPKQFNNIRNYGCRNCAYEGRQLSHDEVVARCLAAKYPAELMEPYKGHSQVKHWFRFLDCPEQHEHEVAPFEVITLGQGCGACRFDQGPTYLYLIEHEGLDAYKIGVTAVEQGKPKNSRIYRHGLDGWTLVHKVEFATRKEALALETAIVDSWRDQGFPYGVTKEQMKFRGEGETVSRKLVTAKSIKEMMRSNCYPGESWNTTSKVSMMAAAANCV